MNNIFSRSAAPAGAAVSERLRTILIFLGGFAILLLLHGNRLILSGIDEGIFLEAAQRMYQGQKLYVDFFGYMSPGCYWVHELSFHLFGVTLRAARIPTLLYLAADAALLYWLAVQLTSRAAAAAATIFFLIFAAGNSATLTAQHRWDSGAISLLAIACAVRAHRTQSRLWIGISGALCVCATAFTPSVALVGAATFCWLLVWPANRRLALPFTTGCALMACLLVIYMSTTGIWTGFIRQMRWLAQNYSDVNIAPYGWVNGGYADLLSGGFSFEWIVRATVVTALAIPAMLPVAVALGTLAVYLRHGRNTLAQPETPVVLYLLLCMAAVVGSSYPRPDTGHLAFIVMIPYVLAAWLAAEHLPRKVLAPVLMFATFAAGMFALQTGFELATEKTVNSPVGRLRVHRQDAPAVEALLSHVRPGDGLFVHPYLPLLYFLTQGNNPTRYSYLAPGMMKLADESLALRGLTQNPPKWLLHNDIDAATFSRVFPSGDASKVGYQRIEGWIHQKYGSAAFPAIAIDGYQLFGTAPTVVSQRRHAINSP
ncbi:MAG TPA: glycosyltransferase family 39 protein [Bryobacteraceae bacterium]|nr:glycosyltransferase family 39 protein [Bryobacteraceae bacterium]